MTIITDRPVAADPEPQTDPARAAYTSGLRKLADLLDAHPEVPLPFTGTASSELLWILGRGDNQREVLARIARMLPGPVRKGVRDKDFDLIGQLDGLHVQVIADRDEVCERVVNGTTTITEEVPDPEVKVPTVTVTREVEQVEWRCGSILRPAADASLEDGVA